MDFVVECHPLKCVDLSFQEQSMLFDEQFCDWMWYTESNADTNEYVARATFIWTAPSIQAM